MSAAATGGVDDAIRDFVDDYYTAGTAEVQGERLLTGALLAQFYAHRNFLPVWTEPGRVADLLQLLAGAEAEGLDPEDYKLTLNEAVESGDLRGFMERRVSRGPLYQRVRSALETYRRIEATGGWGTIAAGRTLRPGDADISVTAIRQRLAVTEDHPLPVAAGADPTQFDQTLADAVRRFQSRHNLEVDGIVGPATLRAMNVPVSDRIDQLRLTLERACWIMSEADRSVVVVNIAAGEVYVVEEGKWIWERRAIVGRLYRQTPLFRGLMTYLEINPTWTVPPGILRNDILPQVRKDPGYLARSNMTLLDPSGEAVDPYSVDWQSLRGMPYTFRQDPFELAALLLRDPVNWSDDKVRAAVATGTTRRIDLPRPWPVYLLYWTAEADDGGTVRFFADVYQRDAPLLEALNAPVDESFPAPSVRAS